MDRSCRADIPAPRPADETAPANPSREISEAADIAALLRRARAGDGAALGQLLELYRNYLRVLAAAHTGAALRPQVDPSDMVQETFLEAWRDFTNFFGATEQELLAWLRKILARNLMDQAKRFGAQGRDVRRQKSLEALLDRSSTSLQKALAAGISSPSARAMRRESSVLLADVLARLPEDHRQVIILRNLQHLKFEEVARRMGRSVGAARVLWTRALARVRQLMEKPGNGIRP